MKITNFQGNQNNSVNGIVREYTLTELSSMFSTPTKGSKHIGYFVRGELDPAERKDVNLASADVLVLDGDCTSKDATSCCPPIDVNIALTEMGINHFIYTTHSHSMSKNKFRVVIPCKIDNKENLKATVNKILKELNAKDVDIKNVKEMSTWSQPWFIPSRDDVNDGVFEHYEYIEGKDYEQVKPKSNAEESGSYKDADNDINDSNVCVNDSGNDCDNYSDGSSPESISDIIATITNGGTGLHQAINKYAYMQIKDGVAREVVIQTLKGLMSSCPVHDERWQNRFDDISRSVDSAVAKLVDDGRVDLSDIEDEGTSDIQEIPWPPGMLGELSQSAYDMQLYQYKEVAVVSAIGLIAGIAGRKFNISGTGLNVYLTLIMDTGMGKDSIVKFISKALFDIVDEGDNIISSSFLGKSKFTGSKAIVNRMKNALSQISVFTEAGLLMQTKSGDQSGLLRALLDLYTKSGAHDVFIGAEYSDEDKSIPNLRAPALSIINESTADSLQQAFRDNNSIDSGHLPRQSIYRIVGKKPYRNWESQKSSINDKCMDKLRNLAAKCAKVQATPNPQAWNFEFGEGIYERADRLEKYFTDQYNEYKDVNNTKANMASRMSLKALKFSAIASVFNHHDLIIQPAEWEWAESMVHYEYSGVDKFFMSSGSGEMYDIARHVVGPCIVRMLTNKYRSAKTGLSKTDRDKGIFPLATLSFNLKNNSAVKKLDDDSKTRTNPKTGVQKVIDYMVTHDFLTPINEMGRRKRVYKVTPEFKMMMLP